MPTEADCAPRVTHRQKNAEHEQENREAQAISLEGELI